MADLTDDPNDRVDTLEMLVRRLTALMFEQHERNQRLDAVVEELREANHQQREFNADVKTTLARLDTLMHRMIRGETNGRDA